VTAMIDDEVRVSATVVGGKDVVNGINLGILLFRRLLCETTMIHCLSPWLPEGVAGLTAELRMVGLRPSSVRPYNGTDTY
jgi:hypothetical protein